jgi:hypothetical protein
VGGKDANKHKNKRLHAGRGAYSKASAMGFANRLPRPPKNIMSADIREVSELQFKAAVLRLLNTPPQHKSMSKRIRGKQNKRSTKKARSAPHH